MRIIKETTVYKEMPSGVVHQGCAEMILKETECYTEQLFLVNFDRLYLYLEKHAVKVNGFKFFMKEVEDDSEEASTLTIEDVTPEQLELLERDFYEV